MPVYIEKYGDLVGCYHSGTTNERTTNKERYFFFYFFFYLVGPLSALDRGYPKFMLQYKSQDFVHTLRGVSALDSSPHILVTNGLGQSRSRRSPKPLSSLHTGTPGSWSPSQRSDPWRQVLDHPFLAHQALLKENCPKLL